MIATAEYTISKIYDGQPGQPGSPGASVSSITRYYTISTSPTQLINPSWADPDEPEWTTTQPSTDAIDETHYLWQKDITTLSNGNTIESNAWCERIISGIISQVNYDAGIISDKVWEDYTNTQISAYDGSTTTTLGRKVSSMEQTVNGYDITVSGQTTHVDGLTERMTSAEGRLSVNENVITAMVTLDDQSSSLTLTNNMIEAMTNQFIVKSPDGRRTVISGGRLSTDAIQSNNYQAPTWDEETEIGTYPYSVSGSLFDLSDGKILTPYFALIPDSTGVTGTAYLNGTIETESGHIGGFVITENAIYHNKIDATSVDLSDDIYIINNDPYILDEEDYLYGGYASLYEVYMGIDGISCGFGKFAVDSTGELFASNATIKGNITATSGSFGLTNGYYEIDDDGLVGYKVKTSYYFKMIEVIINEEYDEGTIKLTDLSVETSSQTYSYSDILAMSVVTGIDLKYEDDKIYVIIRTDSAVSISELFNGTITTISCSYTYEQSGEEAGGGNETYDYSGITAAITENNDYITGTEVGYDYLKTDKIIASDGLSILDTNGTSIAYYGAEITIGQSENSNLRINSYSMNMYYSDIPTFKIETDDDISTVVKTIDINYSNTGSGTIVVNELDNFATNTKFTLGGVQIKSWGTYNLVLPNYTKGTTKTSIAVKEYDPEADLTMSYDGNKTFTITGHGTNYNSLSIMINQLKYLTTGKSTTLYIGNEGSSYIKSDYHSFQLIDKNGEPYFYISDLLDGDNNITDTYVGDGSTTRFYLSHRETSVVYDDSAVFIVTIDDYITTDYSWYDSSSIEFTTPPSLNSIIKIKYTPLGDFNEYKAYSFGKRKANSIIGSYSVASGYGVEAEGKFSMAHGWTNDGRIRAEAEGSIAIGCVSGNGAFINSAGDYSIASGYVSANNGYISTVSPGVGSTARGYIESTAHDGSYIATAGNGSFAHGAIIEGGDMGTSRYAEGAVALNTGTWAMGKAQTVIGTFNALDTQGNVTNHPSNASGNSSAYYTKYAFIIGNGYWNKTNNTEVRSNAMTVDWFGHITALSFEVPTGHDLLLKSDGGTYTVRLTQYGNFRPEGVGTQSLGTSGNPWKDVWANDTTINPSDRKLKDNIDEISFSEKLIMNLKPITYMWKNGDHRRKRMGFIAQDVANVCKNIGENLSIVTASYKSDEQKIYLGEDVDDSLLNWGMSYNQLIAPMVSVIQSHENTIIELKNKINKLESYIKEIKGQMS